MNNNKRKTIIIAREKWYKNYNPYNKQNALYAQTDHVFSNLNAAYQAYDNDGFVVEKKFKGAYKDFEAARCVVQFFEMPLEDTGLGQKAITS